jgi:hypothetical protein
MALAMAAIGGTQAISPAPFGSVGDRRPGSRIPVSFRCAAPCVPDHLCCCSYLLPMTIGCQIRNLTVRWFGMNHYDSSLNQKTLFLTSSAARRPKKRKDRRSKSLIVTWSESRMPKCSLPFCLYWRSRIMKSLMLWVRMARCWLIAYSSCSASVLPVRSNSKTWTTS